MNMRIGIVNDLAMAREALRRALADAPGVEIAWTAVDGAEAIAKASSAPPDVILMDLIMPGVDGVEATRQIMSKCPCAIVVVTATVEGNSSRVYEALGAGALDAVDTPRIGAPGGSAALLEKIEAVRRMRSGDVPRAAMPKARAGSVSPPSCCAPQDASAPIVAIGASTGGPQALATVLQGMPMAAPFATVIVQHMEASFLPGLASWLADKTGRPVRLATAGEQPPAGAVLIAGQQKHLVVLNRGTVCYSECHAELIHRPSVDVLFGSLALSNVEPGTAVLLTGMGRDGAQGLLELRRRGWTTIAQDKPTSVVWGMPGTAVELEAATSVLPLSEIGPAITAAMALRRATRVGGAR